MRNQETKEKQRQAYSAIVIDNTLQAMRLQNSHAGTTLPLSLCLHRFA
jgi:hypothetical protein